MTDLSFFCPRDTSVHYNRSVMCAGAQTNPKVRISRPPTDEHKCVICARLDLAKNRHVDSFVVVGIWLGSVDLIIRVVI